MLMQRNGLWFILTGGRVWLDHFTQCSWNTWNEAQGDPSAIIWKYGQFCTGFAID